MQNMRECWKKNTVSNIWKMYMNVLRRLQKADIASCAEANLTRKKPQRSFLMIFAAESWGESHWNVHSNYKKEIHKAGREDRERQIEKKTAGGKCEEKEQKQQKE